jgi:uncharacterized membrane protein YozB (DUF420 family)
VVFFTALEIAEANLALQVGIFFAIAVGYGLKRKRKYFLHGMLMLAAVVLNAFSFFLVMGPSLFNMGEFIFDNFSSRLALVAVFHGVFGALAEILGILLLAVWGFRASTQNCARKRKLMWPTLILWIVALVLGIVFYAINYLGY